MCEEKRQFQFLKLYQRIHTRNSVSQHSKCSNSRFSFFVAPRCIPTPSPWFSIFLSAKLVRLISSDSFPDLQARRLNCVYILTSQPARSCSDTENCAFYLSLSTTRKLSQNPILHTCAHSAPSVSVAPFHENLPRAKCSLTTSPRVKKTPMFSIKKVLEKRS